MSSGQTATKGPGPTDAVAEAERGLLYFVTAITYDPADRVRSYQLLAEEWQRR